MAVHTAVAAVDMLYQHQVALVVLAESAQFV
jgi:hypothetical protein